MQPTNSNDTASLTSAQMHESVLTSFKLKESRQQLRPNGKLEDDEIQKFCIISPELQELMRQASEQFGLSFRSVNKVLKVARTISDLENSLSIEKGHLLEALSYRRR